MPASSITTFLNIKFGHKRELEKLLKEVGNPIKEANPHLQFSPATHFARLVILPGINEPVCYPGQEPSEPDDKAETRHYRLMLNAVFDGDDRQFVQTMIDLSPGLDQIFGYCEGYSGAAGLYDYLTNRKHLRQSQIFYDTFYGETVESINGKADQRIKMQNIFDENPLDIALQKILQLSPINTPYVTDDTGSARQNLILTGLVAIILLGATGVILWSITPLLAIAFGVIVAGVVLWVVNIAAIQGLKPSAYGAVEDEIAEHDELLNSPTEYYPVSMLTGREDVVVQNQFNLYLTFKGGWIERHLRLFLMIVLMYVLGKSTQIWRTPGSLGGLTTVHFGHWIVIDGGRRLFFITNYDGSWETYIADFVNKIYKLLDVQLINFIGFSGEGTRNIAAFRRWLRRVQIQSDVFYSGYPLLTVRNTVLDRQIDANFPKSTDSHDPKVKDWLKLLGSPQFNQPGKEPAKDPRISLQPRLTKADWHDIQAFIVYGYGNFAYGRYLFLNIHDAEKAKIWLASVIPLITNVAQWDENEAHHALTYAVNIALTNPALEKLSVEDETLKTFSREFREGIAPEPKGREDNKDLLHPRSIILGDTGSSAPWNWRVGNPADRGTDREIHILLLFSAVNDEIVDNLLKNAALASIFNGSAGVSLVFTEQGWMPMQTGREAFGFHDGISNPWVEGTRYNIRHRDGSRGEPLKIGEKQIIKEDKDGSQRVIGLDYDPVVRTGEFILGYPNEYGQLPLTPLVWNDTSSLLKPFATDDAPASLNGVKDLGRNGSYLVYRKLHQDVEGFWGYMTSQAKQNPDGTPDTQDAVKLAAKMVGRWPSGVPLTLSPEHDDYERAKEAGYNNSLLNNFHYRMKDELNDDQGLRCPFGSHLRRGNPRDSLVDDNRAESHHNSNLHRIMRRAVAFGKLPDHQLDPDYFQNHGAPLTITYALSDQYPADPDGVGIHFFGINSNIQQQFEFIQQAWDNNARFNGMYDNKDPLTGDNVQPLSEAVRLRANAKFAEQGVDQVRLQTSTMTIPEEPIRRRLHEIPRFVNVKGGAYLFIPSIAALKYFAQLPPKPPQV
ncbi:MAG: hypothetical protein H7X77_07865 [Anaerolineae bacterium]|nr:hypothetical protein [Anaerolineae bacterium]